MSYLVPYLAMCVALTKTDKIVTSRKLCSFVFEKLVKDEKPFWLMEKV